MSLFERIKDNKGTVSTALGKTIAQEIMGGDTHLIPDAIALILYDITNVNAKNIRATAAKIIELVAEKSPALVADHLDFALPALQVEEPQTKWMVFRSLGFCAKLRPDLAQKALPAAKQYLLEKKKGQLCLVGAIDLFLGDYGATSAHAAQETYKLLLKSTHNVITNEHDWILEAFIKIIPHLSSHDKQEILSTITSFHDIAKPATQKRMKKLLKVCV